VAVSLRKTELPACSERLVNTDKRDRLSTVTQSKKHPFAESQVFHNTIMSQSTHLSIELLRTFLLLIDGDGNAGKTADALGINQPSMSKRLNRLQFPGKTLEKPWLSRAGKTWRPTEEGKRMLPAVREVLRRYRELHTFATNQESDRREVQFACGRQAATRFVRRAARRFWKEHPDIHLRVSTLSGPARVEGVANGLLDLATVAHDEKQIREMARRDLHIETLFKDRLALVCHPRCRWAKAFRRLPKFKVKPRALGGFPLLLPAAEAGVRTMFDEVLAKCRMLDKLDIRLEVSSWTAIMAYASDKLGVGMVSESAVPKPSAMMVRYLDPAVIKPFREQVICRRAANEPSRLDLTPEAYGFYKILKRAARQRWE
jgi:DNA-binding transcriptional LysR family regulator